MRRGLVILAVASALVLAGEAAASAATVTVGSPITPIFAFAPTGIGGPATVANGPLAETGANTVSPVTGVIVRWRMYEASGGPFRLRVLSSTGGSTYTGAGTSSPETPTRSDDLETFATNLPIRAGETIGLDSTTSTDELGYLPSGSSYGFWAPPLADGSSPRAFTPGSGAEFAFNADVVPPPGVASMAPTSGPVAGGTHVVIQGHDLSGATAVNFGGRPASSFTVVNDSQISAVAPPGVTAGPVDVTVTTQGGTSPTSAVDRFTYAPVLCVVPRLKGKTLKKARKLLTAAHCTLGLVAKPPHSKGEKLVVKAQSPASRTARPSGETVSVKLGPKPHHKKRH